MLGTTGIPRSVKIPFIRLTIARFSSYISFGVRGNSRSLSCLYRTGCVRTPSKGENECRTAPVPSTPMDKRGQKTRRVSEDDNPHSIRIQSQHVPCTVTRPCQTQTHIYTYTCTVAKHVRTSQLPLPAKFIRITNRTQQMTKSISFAQCFSMWSKVKFVNLNGKSHSSLRRVLT